MNIKLPTTFLLIATMLIFCALWLGACQGVTAVAPTPTLEASATPTPKASATPSFPLAFDNIRIKKYPSNYTAFKIEVQGGATIITDPFLMDEKVHTNIVTESHQHGDHTDVSSILEPYQLFKEPGVFDVAGVKVTGVGGVHNKPASSNLNNPNVIFVFDLGSIRLAEFGSQGDVPTPDMFAQIGKVDVLIIQVFNGNSIYKMNIADAKKIVEQLSPRVIIPAHGDPSVNADLAKLLGADFRQEPSGILELSRSVLDGMEKPIVIVLDHY